MPEAEEQRFKSKELSDQHVSLETGPHDTTSISFQSFDDSHETISSESLQAFQLAPGDRIAEKYEVIERISSGGMGSVYKALHKELGKYVAIKVLLVDKLVKDVTYRRFEREAKAAGSLNHPNIVSVYDYGMISDNRPYIVMELLDGINLEDWIGTRGYLEPPLVIHIFSQVCEALEHAHARALIHRDLKPSNIMLSGNDRDKKYVKIIDFGIAKFSTKKPETRPITKPGQIFGSPLYMSPEQCVGQKLDPRSDIYSLGCVMYEAISGAPPFLGDTLLSTIYKHVNEPPPPLKEHVHGRNVPAALERIVARMLQKHPDDRFQSASEVLAALEQVRLGQERASSDAEASSKSAINSFFANKHVRMISSIAIPVLLAIVFKAVFDLINQADRQHAPGQPRSHQSEKPTHGKAYFERKLLTETNRKAGE